MPFHKSGSKSDITNYRGNSILPRLLLCLEKLLFNFIYSNVRHKLSRRQHGFVKSAARLHNCWNMLKLFTNVLMPMKISVLYILTFKRLLTLCHTNSC